MLSLAADFGKLGFTMPHLLFLSVYFKFFYVEFTDTGAVCIAESVPL